MGHITLENIQTREKKTMFKKAYLSALSIKGSDCCESDTGICYI